MISKKIIKAMAIQDMYKWIENFENDGEIEKYDDETQKIYWNCIKSMQEKLYKEL